MRRLLLSALVTATVLAPWPVFAQTAAQAEPPTMAAVDTSLFHGLTFRLVGPSRGGRVTTVTGVPSQPQTFYMGAASGGLFKTTDGGGSWSAVTDGQVPLGSTGDVAVATSDPNIVYLGTGSDGLRSNVSTGRGVYRSADAGATWQFAGLYDVGQIGAVRIHPTNPDIVWVAANGDAFKPHPERGIFKTTDGGRSWRKVLFVSDSTGAMDVELQPGNPDVVYAWMNRIERKPWAIISGSHEGGFYKSTDGGEKWTRITTGLPGDLIGKGNLAVTADNPARVYALVEAKPGGGFYRSDDGGQTWALINDQGSLITRPFYYTTLAADPTNADIVYAGAEGFFKSTDAGQSFTRFPTPHGDNHDMWISPVDGNTMIQSNDGGANVSYDGGRTWSTQGNQPTAEIYGIWTDNAFPYRLYGAQQDNSTFVMSSLATGGEEGEDWWSDTPGCETGPVIPHPSKPDIVYGSCKGQYGVMNMETGQEKQYWVGAQSLYGNDARDLILRFQRVSPMDVSPHDPDVLYYGSQHVHRTRDLGVTWETISPDLTANPECCQGTSGIPITRDVTGEEFYSTLYAIRESLLEPGVIWVGSNDGPFHITRDNGKTWTDITPQGMPEGGRVAFIDPSPHRPGSAYYAVYRYLLGDYEPYLYRTDDYGRTWTRLTDGTNGIPGDWPTRVVREDPDREGLLYAGTEFGLFISFDNGAHWQSFDRNLPNVPIQDIKLFRKDLIIVTQGRSLWIMDNVSALHQLTPQVATQDVHLYKPRDGYRTRDGANILGPNIEYYFANAPAAGVSIDILDAGGQVVNTYRSGATAGRGGGRRGGGGGDPDDDMMAGRGRGGAGGGPRVTQDAGHNRFVWDVRHSNGLTVPPGQYTARLTVNGTAHTQPFNVLIDPRIAAEGTTVADLVEQYQHNTRMRAMVAEAEQLGTRLREAQTRLANATGEGAETLRQVNALASELFAEEVRYGKPGLETHISYLAGMTARTDQKIGRDAIERHAVLRQQLDDLTARVNQLLGPATR
ncbi:MAG: VPS10 domain-containing protein [Longimicrobiales bacterium]